MKIAIGLGLNGPPLRNILDLGCGPGLFARYCLDNGHTVVGLDCALPPIVEATQLLDVPLLDHYIKACEELPPFPVGVDMVTMFGVNLKHSKEEWFSEEDYKFLFDDILRRLPIGGEIVVRPNHAPQTLFLLNETWWAERFSIIPRFAFPFQMKITKNE